MTPRQRFHGTLDYAPTDRAPLWEEGIRDDVRQIWAEEGLPADTDLSALFTYDRREEISLHNLERWTNISPERDYPAGVTLWNGILQQLGIEDWRTLEPVLLTLADTPDDVERRLAEVTERHADALSHIPDSSSPDFALFDEPIAGSYGSVLSPAYFRRFCAPYYRRMVDLLSQRGVRWFIVRSYGNPVVLLPEWVDAGVNVFWCYEGAFAGVHYPTLRRIYGHRLRLIGGFDLRAVLAGGVAIERALNGWLPGLVRDGGYLPLVDGRIRKEVRWHRYRQYRWGLESLVCGGKAC